MIMVVPLTIAPDATERYTGRMKNEDSVCSSILCYGRGDDIILHSVSVTGEH